jgi:PAS domain S-box-containing protein
MSPYKKSLMPLLKQAKIDLSLNETRSQILIEKHTDMITLGSPEGKVIYISPSFTRGLGYTLEEMKAFKPFELIHPEEKERLEELLQQIVKVPGTSFSYQFRVHHKNGNWIWCEGTMTNLLDDPGINALLVNFRDLTKQKEMSEAFEKSERKFRTFFEMAPVGIAIVDPESITFTKLNAKAIKLLKFSCYDLIGKSTSVISPEFQPDGSRSEKKAKIYVQKANNGKKQVFEWLVKNGEGDLVLFEVRMILIQGADKPLLYLSFVDITERKKAEQRIIDQNIKLTQIAALQSHQVRQPVANILGLISLFNLNDPADPLNAEIIIKLKSASLRFDAIVKEIIIRTHEIEKLNEYD